MSESIPMVNLVEEYLEYRRRLGYRLLIEGQILLGFARYADRSGHRGPLTTELAARWARLPAEAAPLYQARRLEVVRCFARHRAIFDPATEIPPEGFPSNLTSFWMAPGATSQCSSDCGPRIWTSEHSKEIRALVDVSPLPHLTQ
jgi:hypothetical protein